MAEFKIGERVMYRGDFGNAPAVQCLITGIGTKNGETVYDNDLGRWGYADQYRKPTAFETVHALSRSLF